MENNKPEKISSMAALLKVLIIIVSIIAVVYALSVLLSSCKKERVNDPAGAEVRFTLKGQNYDLRNFNFIDYNMNFANGKFSGESFGFLTNGQRTQILFENNYEADSAAVGTKNVADNGSTSIFTLNSTSWENNWFTFTLTRKSNGTVDGTFIGIVAKDNSPTVVETDTISNGQFINIPIKYNF
jgi:hypothetical protein